MSEPQPPQVHLNVELPMELRNGVHAELAAVWHTRDSFTIDFIAPISPAAPADGGDYTQPAQVVSRVRVPVSVIFNIARAISDNVAIYESSFGSIGPGGPDHPAAEGQ
jgi:hypothetical protein